MTATTQRISYRKHSKLVSVVVRADGKKIVFTEKMSNAEAVRQAKQANANAWE